MITPFKASNLSAPQPPGGGLKDMVDKTDYFTKYLYAILKSPYGGLEGFFILARIHY